MHADQTIFVEQVNSTQLLDIFMEWAVQHPGGGILALVAEQSLSAVEALQAQANQAGCALIGAVFPELIVAGELRKQGVLLMQFEEIPPHCITSFTDDSQDAARRAGKIAECLNIDMQDEDQALFLIFDSMVPNVASIIDALYLSIGDVVHYMGVNAGSETFQPMNCLFDNKQFVGNGVLVMLMKQHSGGVLEHGYTSPDLSIAATSTTGNRISSIDWQPAFEVYKELALKHYGVQISKDNFYENAVHFPIGIMRMDGEMLVRIPVAFDDDGALYCVGEVPENSVLTLLKAVLPDSSKTIDALADKMQIQAEDAILMYYCAGRRMHLGEAAGNELNLLKNKLGNRNIVGALSLGEIGGSKQGGYPLYHNASLVHIPLK